MKIFIGFISLIYFCCGKLLPLSDEGKINIFCLQAIILRDINDTTNNVLITQENETVLELGLTFYKTDNYNLDMFLSNMKHKPQTYTISLDDVGFLNETLSLIVNSLKFYDANYIIIIKDNDKAEEVAKILWNFRLLKSKIIVFQSSLNSFKVYKIRLEKCGEEAYVSLIFRNTYNQSCIINQELLEIDMKSPFRKCPLYTIWTSLPPFIYLVDGEPKGIFVDLLDSFNYISDRSVVFRPYNQLYMDEISWGFYYGTADSDMEREYAQMFVGVTDILLAGIFDLSPIITADTIIILVPIPLVDYWSVFFKLINYKRLLIYFSGLLLIAIVFHKYAQLTENGRFNSIENVFFVLFGVCIGIGTLKKWPRNMFLRLFLANILLPSIVLIFFTQGSILSILSGSVYGKPITSVYEFIETDIPLKLIKGVDLLLASSARTPEYNIMYQHYSELPNGSTLMEAGNAILKERNFATISDMAFLLMRPNINKAFSYFDIWNLRLCIMMRKHQYFYQQFYGWILTIMESGFYEKFKKLYQSRVALKYSVEPEKRTFVLSMRHITPAYVFLCCGMILSLAVFFAELLYKGLFRMKYLVQVIAYFTDRNIYN